MRLNSVLLTMALSLTFAPLASAQSQAPAHPPSAPAGAAPTTPRGAAPPTRKLSEPQVISALKERGFTEIRTVRRNGDTLRMEAKKNGKPVKLMVNTATGRLAVQPR